MSDLSEWRGRLEKEIGDANGRGLHGGWSLTTITGTIEAALSVVREAFEAGQTQGVMDAAKEIRASFDRGVEEGRRAASGALTAERNCEPP